MTDPTPFGRRRCLSAAKTRIVLPALSVLVCILLASIARTFAQVEIQDTALKLYQSLTEDQKEQSTPPFDSPERNSQVYTGGKCPGLQIKSLTPDQQKLALDLLTQFTSPYGKQKAEAISIQKPNNPPDDPGLGRYYVCFFGEPAQGKNYAWRIAEHHLTIVHVEVENGKPTTFGPILLGADPPDLWDTEEEKMIALYTAMTEAERAKSQNQGKSTSSEPRKPTDHSIRFSDLSPTAKVAAKAVLDNRLSFFSEDIQKRIRTQLENSGGPDSLQISFYGEATKRCREGGRWDFKLSNDNFLCDYENTRAHIHMSLKSAAPSQ